MREEIERILTELKRRRLDAEAQAGHAAERLVRLLSGMTPLNEVDEEQVRAIAETFADSAARLRLLEGFSRDLRGLLM